MFAQPVTDQQLNNLHTPTLVIWGRDDKLQPVENGRHIAAQIPGARTEIIDDCGHIPSVEQPRAFLTALGAFLGVTRESVA
jgi:pimeloyl-ACP methyl ester carboxylesterase